MNKQKELKMSKEKIIVLDPCRETKSFYIQEFSTYEEAIKFLKSSCLDDLSDFKFYKGEELELTLTTKETKND